MAISRRLKAIALDPQGIADILTGVAEVVPLPDGIVVERFGYKWETCEAIVFISHDSFPEVESGAIVDLIPLQLRLNQK